MLLNFPAVPMVRPARAAATFRGQAAGVARAQRVASRVEPVVAGLVVAAVVAVPA